MGSSVPHEHPDSVMVTLSSFRRRLSSGDRQVDVELEEPAPVPHEGATPLGPSGGDATHD